MIPHGKTMFNLWKLSENESNLNLLFDEIRSIKKVLKNCTKILMKIEILNEKI